MKGFRFDTFPANIKKKSLEYSVDLNEILNKLKHQTNRRNFHCDFFFPSIHLFCFYSMFADLCVRQLWLHIVANHVFHNTIFCDAVSFLLSFANSIHKCHIVPVTKQNKTKQKCLEHMNQVADRV